MGVNKRWNVENNETKNNNRLIIIKINQNTYKTKTTTMATDRPYETIKTKTDPKLTMIKLLMKTKLKWEVK